MMIIIEGCHTVALNTLPYSCSYGCVVGDIFVNLCVLFQFSVFRLFLCLSTCNPTSLFLQPVAMTTVLCAQSMQRFAGTVK